jgi:hypothetical protein
MRHRCNVFTSYGREVTEMDWMYEIARRRHQEELERIRLERLVRDAHPRVGQRGRPWGRALVRRR